MADEIHYMLRALLVFYALLSLELSYAFLAYSFKLNPLNSYLARAS